MVLSAGDAFWSGRRVLVTGHTGFKGAWLAQWLGALGADVDGLALPAAGDGIGARLEREGAAPRQHLVDLRDRDATSRAVAASEAEVIFHLAAQAIVRTAYGEPVEAVATNVLGTAHLLEAARGLPGLRAVVVVTTDKVYADASRPAREEDRLGGTDPYGGSKVMQEQVVATWRASFLGGRGVATARAGNVIGGGDAGAERLVPDILRARAAGRPVVLRRPDAVRPWQHVLEPLSGYVALAERLARAPAAVPPALNFGPGTSDQRPVIAVTRRLLSLLGGAARIEADGARPVEAAPLRLDSGLAARVLGWQPRLDVGTALRWTVAWHDAVAAGGSAAAATLAQITAYRERGAASADRPAGRRAATR